MIAPIHRVRQLLGLGSGTEAELSAALFSGVRWRLTVWYSAGLAVALLLAGLVLYAGVQHSLMSPIDQNLRSEAATLSASWENEAPGFPIPPCARDRFSVPDSVWVCYDQRGNVLAESPLASQLGPTVSEPSLVSSTLRNGTAEDTVGSGSGTLRRYAVTVPSSGGGSDVIQVGWPIGPQLQTLDTLLHLMLLMGALTVLFAVIGGLFLANRALLPARLAYQRQQDFIADASHELRTPLTMLRSNVEVVLRGRDRLRGDDVELLEDTVAEAAHLTAIANTMLDLARLDGNGAHLEEEIVDLAAIGTEVARWAGSLAQAQGLAMHVDASGPALVVADRTLLQQAALILVDNAIKYNRPQGSVDVRTWVAARRAYLQVTDTGIGIDAAHLARIGERFYRVDKARSRASGGVGLGLSLVRGIADRHGGSFRLESDPARGTAATLELPAAQARDAGMAGTGSEQSTVLGEPSRRL